MKVLSEAILIVGLAAVGAWMVICGHDEGGWLIAAGVLVYMWSDC